MKTLIALTVPAALAAAHADLPLLTIAVLLLAGAVFGARSLAAWRSAKELLDLSVALAGSGTR